MSLWLNFLAHTFEQAAIILEELADNLANKGL
jgi:hypothetical protein